MTAGLFLHVGYSLTEQQLIETNSPVRLTPTSVATKLATLLNQDSASQVRFVLHLRFRDSLFLVTESTVWSLEHIM